MPLRVCFMYAFANQLELQLKHSEQTVHSVDEKHEVIPQLGQTEDLKIGNMVLTSFLALTLKERHNDKSVFCLYNVAGWGVMSLVHGVIFQCGNTVQRWFLGN